MKSTEVRIQAEAGQASGSFAASRWGGKALLAAFLLVTAVAILFPVALAFLGSFMTNDEITSGGHLLPQVWQLSNYKEAWVQAHFSRFTWNSLFMSATTTAGTLLIASMAAYAAGRMDFPGKSLYVALQASTMFISIGAVVLRPQFLLMVDLGLQKSLWGVILILISGHAYIFFILLSFMKGISREMDEAARMDGCTSVGIYWRIVMPLMRPALGVAGLFTFIGAWNEYLRPLVFTMANPGMQTLTVGLSYLRYGSSAALQTHYMMAGACLSILPLLIVYAFANKSFMQMTAGSLKG